MLSLFQTKQYQTKKKRIKKKRKCLQVALGPKRLHALVCHLTLTLHFEVVWENIRTCKNFQCTLPTVSMQASATHEQVVIKRCQTAQPKQLKICFQPSIKSGIWKHSAQCQGDVEKKKKSSTVGPTQQELCALAALQF